MNDLVFRNFAEDNVKSRDEPGSGAGTTSNYSSTFSLWRRTGKRRDDFIPDSDALMPLHRRYAQRFFRDFYESEISANVHIDDQLLSSISNELMQKFNRAIQGLVMAKRRKYRGPDVDGRIVWDGKHLSFDSKAQNRFFSGAADYAQEIHHETYERLKKLYIKHR